MDWTDPNNWKAPADLIEYWKTIVGGAVIIAGGIATFFKWGLTPIRWLWSRFPRKPAAGPAQTAAGAPSKEARPLRFVLEERGSFWAPCFDNKTEGTQISGHWHVTNISASDVVLLKARLEGYQARHCHVTTLAQNKDLFDSRYPIRAQRMTEVSMILVFFPKITVDSEPFVADVIFTDNYEEEHRVRSVTFKDIRSRWSLARLFHIPHPRPRLPLPPIRQEFGLRLVGARSDTADCNRRLRRQRASQRRAITALLSSGAGPHAANLPIRSQSSSGWRGFQSAGS